MTNNNAITCNYHNMRKLIMNRMTILIMRLMIMTVMIMTVMIVTMIIGMKMTMSVINIKLKQQELRP